MVTILFENFILFYKHNIIIRPSQLSHSLSLHYNLNKQNSLCHYINVALWIYSTRGSRSKCSHCHSSKLRHDEIRGGGYAQTFDFTRTGTEQLTTSRVTFSVALFRGVRCPFPVPLFLSLPFLLLISVRPLVDVSQFSVLKFFAPSHLLFLSSTSRSPHSILQFSG